MQFRIEQRFDVTVAQVAAALYDPAFITAMAELPKLGKPEVVSWDDQGDTLHTQVRYAFSGELSSAVRRVVDPAQLTWIEDQTTDRRTNRSQFKILPDHYAGLLRCSGAFALSDDGAGALRVATGQIDVSVPLVGGRVERAIVSGLEEHAMGEVDLVQQWAARRT